MPLLNFIPDNLGFPDFVASTFNIAMGCILPLSEKEDLPDQFGTRHRAALGLSELTDAVCLVVSEERSEVVSVVGGKIVVAATGEPAGKAR